jgi:orotidine-5'-phosphate decarboxylase
VTEIAIAFDVPTLERALELDETLGPGEEFAKIGLELFAAAGPAAVRALRERGRRVFLDLKLHDIPNTVHGAARAAARLGAELLTVHATGGHAMVAAAVSGAAEGNPETRIVAVTLLTSLDAYSMPPGFEQPLHMSMVLPRLLAMAESAGAHGIVCAATDLATIRAMRREPFFAVTPGIRPAGGARDDQRRVTTIAEAVRLGSGMLVLGRPITGAPSPREALEAARAERDAALGARGGIPASQGQPSA